MGTYASLMRSHYIKYISGPATCLDRFYLSQYISYVRRNRTYELLGTPYEQQRRR
jgi:hypothetical protein